MICAGKAQSWAEERGTPGEAFLGTGKKERWKENAGREAWRWGLEREGAGRRHGQQDESTRKDGVRRLEEGVPGKGRCGSQKRSGNRVRYRTCFLARERRALEEEACLPRNAMTTMDAVAKACSVPTAEAVGRRRNAYATSCHPW